MQACRQLVLKLIFNYLVVKLRDKRFNINRYIQTKDIKCDFARKRRRNLPRQRNVMEGGFIVRLRKTLLKESFITTDEMVTR